jgi:endoglucanase
MRAGRAAAAIAFAAALLSPVATEAGSWLDGLPRFRPVDAAVQARDLGRGINIMGSDPFFDGDAGAVFKERYFRDIAARGFRTVRVPQAAVRHADADGRPDPVWLAKLDWVVREAVKNGLNVVIDNNGGCSSQGVACLERTARIWRHLAWHYRRAPAGVLFELYNEPDGAITPDVWNAGIGPVLAAVRASNPTRNVIIGTAHAYNLRDLAELRLPAGDRHIIASFHYYEPYSFTHQGAPFLPPARRPPLGAHFGSAADLAGIARHFDYVAAWSAWYHRPVFLGEFGVLETADPSDRVLWIAAVARAAEARGFAWAYWRFDSDFTAFDVARDTWNEPVARALIP